MAKLESLWRLIRAMGSIRTPRLGVVGVALGNVVVLFGKA
jgi:hypothetical protein